MDTLNKRTIAALLVVLLLASICSLNGCTVNTASESTTAATPEAFTVNVKSISKHGNVVLNTSFDEMRSNGMDIADIITVSVEGTKYDLPIGTAFTDVDSGCMICRFDMEDNEVALAINMGSFATETGIGEKLTIDDEPGYKWNSKIGEITLACKEKKGYIDEYNARNLTRTDERRDYASLSDEEFANFRAVSVSGMKENILYRSSTPIEPAIGRNQYAMHAMEKARIKSVINLDDSVEVMVNYETYPDSYYSTCNIINPEMTYDFGTEEFAKKVKESALFIIENDGPYLIHCKEGKDRTGILCALLECFVGARAEEIANDYMLSYYNFYGVTSDDATYNIILKNNLVKNVCGLLEIDDFETANLKEKAKDYFVSIGMTEEQLAVLKDKLGK